MGVCAVISGMFTDQMLEGLGHRGECKAKGPPAYCLGQEGHLKDQGERAGDKDPEVKPRVPLGQCQPALVSLPSGSG